MDEFGRYLQGTFADRYPTAELRPNAALLNKDHRFHHSARYLFQSFNFRTQSSLMTIALFLTCLLTTYLSWSAVRAFEHGVNSLSDDVFQVSILSAQLRQRASDMILAERDFLAEDLVRGLVEKKAGLDEHKKAVLEGLTQLEALPESDRLKSFGELHDALDAWLELTRGVETQALSGDVDGATARFLQDSPAPRERLDSSLRALTSDSLGLLSHRIEQEKRLPQRLRLRILFSGMILLFLSLANALVFRRLHLGARRLLDWARQHSYRVQLATEKIARSIDEKGQKQGQRSATLVEVRSQLQRMREEMREIDHKTHHEVHRLRSLVEECERLVEELRGRQQHAQEETHELKHHSAALRRALGELIESLLGNINGERSPKSPPPPPAPRLSDQDKLAG